MLAYVILRADNRPATQSSKRRVRNALRTVINTSQPTQKQIWDAAHQAAKTYAEAHDWDIDEITTHFIWALRRQNLIA